MAWPQKDTRRIHVDGTDYLWHLSGDTLYGPETPLTIGRPRCRYYLHVDPYVHDFEIRPANVARVVRWARSNGWCAEVGPTRRVVFVGDTFEWDEEADA